MNEDLEWEWDRRDRWLARWLWIKDLLRYGPSTCAMLDGDRRRTVLAYRCVRDPVLDAAVLASNREKHERGYGVTSSGYIVGSAGDFI